MDIQINRLTLKNFRNIEYSSFNFEAPFTVVIGINGKVKSTLLHALRVACGSFFLGVGEVESRHIQEEEIRLKDQGKFVSPQFPVLVESEGKLGGDEVIVWRRRVLAEGGKTTSSKEDVGFVKERGVVKYKRMQEGEDNLDLPLIAFLGTSRVYGAGRKRGAAKAMRRIFKDGYDSWHEMRSSRYAYEAWLSSYDVLVEQGKEYEGLKDAFFEAVKTANPYIEELKFLRDQLWLKIRMEHYTSDLLPVHLHSDGIVSFTEMVAELAYRCITLNAYRKDKAVLQTKGMVLIDEIDLHLHPNWQRHVIGDLKAAFPNLQFVATTHSPFIVQSLSQEELINLDLEYGEEGLEKDPANYGIEDVAEIEMGVENVARSEAFKKRVEVAKQYYHLIEQGKTSESDEEVAQLRKTLNALEERFSDDPEFVATLQLERKVNGL